MCYLFGLGAVAVSCSAGEGESIGDPTSTLVREADSQTSIVAASTEATEPVRQFSEGGIAIEPAGPYSNNQEVAVLASVAVPIDLYNSTPRLCASVDGDDEICDPTRIPVRPVASAVRGTQGVVLEMPRWHFGPKGLSDCQDENVECRLRWRTESGQFLSSDYLDYSGLPQQPRVALGVVPGPEPGVVMIQPAGIREDLTASHIYSTAELLSIEQSVNESAKFDIEQLDVTLLLGGLCGFGPGAPPIGSESLENSTDWWLAATLSPIENQGDARPFFGNTCDSLLADNPILVTSSDPIAVTLRRNIYGSGGWLDCAVNVCYLNLIARWSHPISDGGFVGSDKAMARTMVDVPNTWSLTEPTISIVEAGPYSSGQRVTVEVRGHPLAQDGLPIGWCRGTDESCLYGFSSFEDGVHRVFMEVNQGSGECGTNLCWFEIGDQSEGQAPSAIVVIPVAD